MFPLSQTSGGKLPKQFLAVIDDKTLLQKTIIRIPASYDVTVVAESQYHDVVMEQAQKAGREVTVITEPFGCNTAAAVLYTSAYEAYVRSSPETVLCFVPADHEMHTDAFQRLLATAVKLAGTQDRVITIGITPTGAETNYGYIKVGKKKIESGFSIEQFVEKPNHRTAVNYIQNGGYYWNAGIFVAKASVFLKNAQQYCPKTLTPLLRAVDTSDAMTQEDAYRQIKRERLNISFDYAVIEKIADSMILIPAPEDLSWNDLGNWEALERYMDNDDAQNSTFSENDATFTACNHVSVCNYTNIPVFIRDMSNLVVVVTNQGILIRPRIES